MDTCYADDIALFANTSSQAESLLCSLKQPAESIGLNVFANKMECLCFCREGAISNLHGGLLKVVDKFTDLGSSILSTESDVNMRLAKACTAIEIDSFDHIKR